MSKTEINYNHKEIEAKWQKFWEQNNLYRFDPAQPGEIYSIDTPPPTVSGMLHIGHICSYTQTEILARYFRMKGCNVYYPMGFDDNGLPSEILTERELGITASDLARPEFIKKCLEVTARYEKEFEELYKRMGFSIDWNLTYTTIQDRTRRISQRSFLSLVDKGFVYRQKEPVMWCPSCKTAIAQAEVKSVEMESVFSDINFMLEDGTPLPIATTRPELLPACVAIFVHPGDGRNRHLVGKKARTPLFDIWVPILADEACNMEKGTGVVMCCTFGDRQDIEWWKTRNLDLKIAITSDGHMNELAGEFKGLPIRAARKMILSKIGELGLLGKQERIVHDVNTHERCDMELEFLSSMQWFIRVMDKKQELIAQAEKIRWFPDFMKTRYVNWVENLAWDWCISRQRFYGVPFPLWYCRKCGEVKFADSGELPVDPTTDEPATPCGKCGSTEFEGEKDVMDTWATSSLTPQINFGWGETDEKPEIFPMSLRPQAHEIIRTWTFYTIVKSLFHENKIPWKNIALSGLVTIQSETQKKKKKGEKEFKAEKISKSRHGDKASPVKLLDEYGADCLRYWSSNSSLGSDIMLKQEEFQIGKRTMTKIWNAFRFISPHLGDFNPCETVPLQELCLMDSWLLLRMNQTIRKASAAFENYDFRGARLEVGDFFWTDLCDNYLEIIKDRLYNPEKRGADKRRGAQFSLYRAGLNVIIMFAPFMPHITEEIYQEQFRNHEKEISIHRLRWSQVIEVPGDNQKLLQAGNGVIEILGYARRYKASQKLSMKAEIPILELTLHPETLTLIEPAFDDLRAVGNIMEIRIVESTEKFKVKVLLPETGFPEFEFNI